MMTTPIIAALAARGERRLRNKKLAVFQNMPYMIDVKGFWKTSMVQIAGQTRRTRGRPQIRPDGETRQLLIAAAQEEFRASGYAGTSMVAVAQRAGVSTRTMYRLIATKADLFKSVVSHRLEGFMLAVDAEALDRLPLAQALERILIAYGELTLTDEVLWVHHLVLSESHRFPELAAAFAEVALRPTSDSIADWLRRQCERGLITLEDTHAAAGMLRGMMSMEPQRAVMLGQRAVLDAEEIAIRAKSCARLFLEGCGARHR
jgi:AcrR family transcriptional regulator